MTKSLVLMVLVVFGTGLASARSYDPFEDGDGIGDVRLLARSLKWQLRYYRGVLNSNACRGPAGVGAGMRGREDVESPYCLSIREILEAREQEDQALRPQLPSLYATALNEIKDGLGTTTQIDEAKRLLSDLDQLEGEVRDNRLERNPLLRSERFRAVRSELEGRISPPVPSGTSAASTVRRLPPR